MNEWFDYLLRVSFSIIAVYAFYALLLRRNTFFSANRLFLVVGLLLSFVVPLLEFSLPAESVYVPLAGTVADFHFAGVEDGAFVAYDVHSGGSRWMELLSLVYFSGVAAMVLRFLFFMFRIIRLRAISAARGAKIYETPDGQAFSFLDMIFLPTDAPALVLAHERVHTRQFHWVDLLFMEAACVLLWFNPFVFLCKRSLKLQHEYLADRSAAGDGRTAKEYLQCMLLHLGSCGSGMFASHFSLLKTKTRIMMITKERTSRKYSMVYLLALPLVGLLTLGLASFSAPQILAQDNEPVVTEVIIEKPSIYPLERSKVKGVALFGNTKKNVFGRELTHRGMDFGAPAGTKIYATADGTIQEAGYNGSWGNRIVIVHNDIYTTMYAHMESCAVKAGDVVTKGQVIGAVGNTGLSTGPHLHYEVHMSGEPVNPKDYMEE